MSVEAPNGSGVFRRLLAALRDAALTAQSVGPNSDTAPLQRAVEMVLDVVGLAPLYLQRAVAGSATAQDDEAQFVATIGERVARETAAVVLACENACCRFRARRSSDDGTQTDGDEAFTKLEMLRTSCTSHLMPLVADDIRDTPSDCAAGVCTTPRTWRHLLFAALLEGPPGAVPAIVGCLMRRNEYYVPVAVFLRGICFTENFHLCVEVLQGMGRGLSRELARFSHHVVEALASSSPRGLERFAQFFVDHSTDLIIAVERATFIDALTSASLTRRAVEFVVTAVRAVSLGRLARGVAQPFRLECDMMAAAATAWARGGDFVSSAGPEQADALCAAVAATLLLPPPMSRLRAHSTIACALDGPVEAPRVRASFIAPALLRPETAAEAFARGTHPAQRVSTLAMLELLYSSPDRSLTALLLAGVTSRLSAMRAAVQEHGIVVASLFQASHASDLKLIAESKPSDAKVPEISADWVAAVERFRAGTSWCAAAHGLRVSPAGVIEVQSCAPETAQSVSANLTTSSPTPTAAGAGKGPIGATPSEQRMSAALAAARERAPGRSGGLQSPSVAAPLSMRQIERALIAQGDDEAVADAAARAAVALPQLLATALVRRYGTGTGGVSAPQHPGDVGTGEHVDATTAVRLLNIVASSAETLAQRQSLAFLFALFPVEVLEEAAHVWHSVDYPVIHKVRLLRAASCGLGVLFASAPSTPTRTSSRRSGALRVEHKMRADMPLYPPMHGAATRRPPRRAAGTAQRAPKQQTMTAQVAVARDIVPLFVAKLFWGSPTAAAELVRDDGAITNETLSAVAAALELCFATGSEPATSAVLQEAERLLHAALGTAAPPQTTAHGSMVSFALLIQGIHRARSAHDVSRDVTTESRCWGLLAPVLGPLARHTHPAVRAQVWLLATRFIRFVDLVTMTTASAPTRALGDTTLPDSVRDFLSGPRTPGAPSTADEALLRDAAVALHALACRLSGEEADPLVRGLLSDVVHLR